MSLVASSANFCRSFSLSEIGYRNLEMHDTTPAFPHCMFQVSCLCVHVCGHVRRQLDVTMHMFGLEIRLEGPFKNSTRPI